MEIAFRVGLFVAGIINLLPSFLVFLPVKIKDSYGVEIPDVNYELLLRHRAVLFGIVGGIMIYSAITKKYYELSTIIGLISMISFLILYKLVNGPVNAELTKVMKVDIAGIVILLIGFLLYKMR